MRFVVGVILALVAPAVVLAQASLTTGDEVVFSGGPGAGPRSIQTGTTVEFNNIRQGPQPGEGQGMKPKARGPGLPMAGMDKLPKMQNCLPDAPVVPKKAPDLTALGTEDLLAKATDPDPLQRVGAMTALGGRTSPTDKATARRAVEEGLADADPRVVQQALGSLPKVADASAGPLALRLVYDADDATAVAAIHAVQALKYAKAAAELAKLGGRDTGAVGQAAKAAAAALSAPAPAARQ
jgi:hypothetical protein